MQRDMSPPSTLLSFSLKRNVYKCTKPLLAAKTLFRVPQQIGNHYVTLTGYCYAVRHGMKVQLVTPYHVSHLQCYGVMVRSNVTSVYLS
jgi:hypothetical protein